MIRVRPAAARGHVQWSWLETWHTFSFGDYYDPAHMGHSVLRVINDDWVAPRSGFGMHPHRDMEIITVMRSGALTHCDSLGHEAVLRAGECQWMSAGRGVMHSEWNHGDEPASLLQIWWLPAQRGGVPAYGQRAFPTTMGRTLIASPDGTDDSFPIRQATRLWRWRSAGSHESIEVPAGAHGWLQVIDGTLESNGLRLGAGDGLAVTGPERLAVTCSPGFDALWFDLP